MNKLLFVIASLISVSCNSNGNKTDLKRSAAPEKEVSSATFKDIEGSWVDNRAISNIYNFTRKELFPPVNSFVFALDKRSGKPTLEIQLSEHPTSFVFDSCIFTRDKYADYDSCFAIKNGKTFFLLQFHLRDSLITDLMLLDSVDKDFPRVAHNKFARASKASISDIEQFSIGKSVIEDKFSISYQGKTYPVIKQNFGGDYKIEGLPEYDYIQFINWEKKKMKRIEVSFCRKGQNFYEGMVQRGGKTFYIDYFLEEQAPKKYLLTRTERTSRP